MRNKNFAEYKFHLQTVFRFRARNLCCNNFSTGLSNMHSTCPVYAFEGFFQKLELFLAFFDIRRKVRFAANYFGKFCQNINPCVQMNIWRPDVFLIKLFWSIRDIERNFFQFLSKVVWQGCQNCIPCVQTKKTGFSIFVSENEEHLSNIVFIVNQMCKHREKKCRISYIWVYQFASIIQIQRKKTGINSFKPLQRKQFHFSF